MLFLTLEDVEEGTEDLKVRSGKKLEKVVDKEINYER